jgi:hypothetical protein
VVLVPVGWAERRSVTGWVQIVPIGRFEETQQVAAKMLLRGAKVEIGCVDSKVAK